MLTPEQIAISDKMLKVIKSIDYSKTITYWDLMSAEGYDYHSVSEIRKLLFDLRLIYRIGKYEYPVKLSPEGNDAEQIGIAKYLSDLEKARQIMDKSVLATITSSKTAKWSLLVAVLALVGTFLPPYYENIIAAKKDSDTKSKNGNAETYDGNKIRSADSTKLKNIKDSIKHDSVDFK